MKIGKRDFLLSGATAFLTGQFSMAPLANMQTGLKDAFKSRFLMGAAINTEIATHQHPDLTHIVKRDFNSITPENAMKWESVRSHTGEWTWGQADAFMAFAEANKLHAVGHCLAWHSQIPDSVFKTSSGDYIKPHELDSKIKNHVSTLVDRYKGKLAVWDAVNEAVGDDNKMRQSHYFNILGEQFIDKVFHYAHDADAKAHLIYNDYNNEQLGKRGATLELLKRLKKRGVPIQGVGMQLHLGINNPSIEDIEDSIEDYSELGLRVHITEMDIDVLPSIWNLPVADIAKRFDYSEEKDPFKYEITKSMDDQLARRYEAMFKLFIKHQEKIDRVTLWGVSDDTTWLNNFPVKGRTNYPLLFDRKHQTKEAYKKLLAL